MQLSFSLEYRNALLRKRAGVLIRFSPASFAKEAPPKGGGVFPLRTGVNVHLRLPVRILRQHRDVRGGYLAVAVHIRARPCESI
jgi:hypothetical protein